LSQASFDESFSEKLKPIADKLAQLKEMIAAPTITEKMKLMQAKTLMREVQAEIEKLSDWVDLQIKAVDRLTDISDVIEKYFEQLEAEKGEEEK